MLSEISILADALLAGGAIQILVGLALLRFALGLQDIVVGLVVVVLAISVSLSNVEFAVDKQANPGHAAVGPSSRYADMMRARLAAANQPASATAPSSQDAALENPQELRSRVAMTDIRRGLIWGVKLLIPFLLIDLLLAHLFAVLEWNAISAQTVATPLKLIVFLSIGGWQQISEWITLAAISGGGL